MESSLTNSGLSPETTQTSWSTWRTAGLPNGIMPPGPIYYGYAAAHDTLVDNKNWNITDGGLIAGCGNGTAEGNEECDDGNLSNTDDCTNACTQAACGDGFVQIGEDWMAAARPLLVTKTVRSRQL